MGRTALMHAVEMRRPECVQQLLDLGADPRSGDYPPAKLAITLGDEETATLLLQVAPPQDDSQREEFFYEALYKGRLLVTRYFLDHGYPLNQSGTWDITPLLAAVMGGSADVVRALVESGADVNLPGAGGVTPLMKAIEFGHNDVAKWLLDRGADPAFTSPQGASATTMFAAASSQEDIELARRLVEAEGEHPASGDTSFLMSAAAGRKSATVALLLERGHDSARCDRQGHTALHYACRGGDPVCIGLIAERGADCNARTDSGETPLTLLLGATSDVRAAVEILLEHGADPTLPGTQDRLPSESAAALGEPELVALFERFGSRFPSSLTIPWTVHRQVAELVQAVDSGTRTEAELALQNPPLEPSALVAIIRPRLVPILFDAVRHGMLAVVACLLDGGASAGLLDGDGNSPLCIAARFSRGEIAELLLKRGANLEAMNERGATPIQLAGSDEIRQLLLRHGARPKN